MGWAKIGILGAIMAVCFAAIAYMGMEVNRKMNEQATASSDNVQWFFSQLEVEYLKLDNAASGLINGQTTTKEVRKRFDVLYSRVDTLQQGAIYLDLRRDRVFSERLAAVSDVLNDVIPIIDGSNAQLYAQSAILSSQMSALQEPVRNLALMGIDFFSAQADSKRLELWLTLGRVAVLTMALVMALCILSVVMFQLFRNSQRSNNDKEIAYRRVNAMVESTLDAVIVINEAGEITEYNGAAEKIFGYSRHEAINAPLVDLIIPLHHRKAHREGMKRYLREGNPKVVGQGRKKLEALRKNGEIFQCEFSIAEATTKESRIFVSFLRDCTDQDNAEKALENARDEALAGERAKAEFLAVMSHEMRTPLNGMLGTIELMADSDLNDQQRGYLKIMETSGRLLMHHVNDVLDIARLDAGGTDLKREPVDLDALLHEVVDGQRAHALANKNVIEIDMTNLSRPTVLGDANRLRQVLLNLISNAIKFTRNGAIRIEAERVGENDMIEFRVSDTGVGIVEGDMQRIFDDFVTLDSSYSRESGGTGLGLGIARRLVEIMDGQIGVESEPGDGSVFWFRLPMPILSSVSHAAPKSAPKTKVVENSGESLDVLIVEDNHINRLVVGEMLTREGHKITHATDGDEGVRMAEMRHFDLILMDISMPTKDGVEATKEIRAGDGYSRDSRIIALTAHALPEDIERFKQAGMNDALVKPISREKLGQILTIKKSKKTHEPEPVSATIHAMNESVMPPIEIVEEDDWDIDDEFIDDEALTMLLEDLGEDVAFKLVANFVSETDNMIGEFAASHDWPDDELIGEIHKLAGSASMFGTVVLRDKLRELETLGKGGQTQEMRDTLSDLDEIWSGSRSSLVEITGQDQLSA